jgi:hypothetical protein
MAKAQKVKHYFDIIKSDEKQSAYLLVWDAVKPLERNDDGMLTVDIADLTASPNASAWTTLNAAKRKAAAHVGRSRLPWVENDENGVKNWHAELEEKITA